MNDQRKSNNTFSAAYFRRNYVDQVEHNIQKACITWFDLQYPGLLLYAIPNGGKRPKATAAKLKAEGVRRGIPDLHLAYPVGDYAGMYIETKTAHGDLSNDQILAHAYLKSQNYWVEIARNLEEFQGLINQYLKQTKPSLSSFLE